MKKKEVILFGVGMDAEKFYYQNKNNVTVQYCLDNNKDGYDFHGNKVFKPDPDKLIKSKKLIVITTMKYYETISEQLQSYGLVEFKDYIYYMNYNKKIALIHGNCHGQIVKNLLESSSEFCEEYSFYPIPLIHLNKKGCIDERILKRCKLFIHQDIRVDNPYGYQLSDEYILDILPIDCIKITIPNLYGLAYGFFPQTVDNPYNKLGEVADGMFPYGDSIIINAMNQGLSIQGIEELVMDPDILSERQVVDKFNEYIEKIKQRENNWDIKILDFILENYKSKKLFYDIGHPTNTIFVEYTKGILHILQKSSDGIYSNDCLDAHETPVYYSVKKWLNLEWDDNEGIRKSGYNLSNKRMNIMEYIKQYIYWCYEQKMENTDL